MAFVVTCPHCSARLKTPGVVVAGTLVACPKCVKNFTLKANSPELLEEAPPLAKPRKKSKLDEDFADDADVFDDERPINSKRKTRLDDEDEDERPRSKKKRARDDDDFDDDEDRPKRRKRRDDDDEDELPSRSTSRKKKKKKNTLVLILAISLPLLFLICGGAGYGIYSYLFGGGASSDMLVWAPTNSDSISGMNYSKISGFPTLKKSLEPRILRLENLGLRGDNIAEIMDAKTGFSGIQVIRTKSAIDVNTLVKSSLSTEKTVGTKKYYRGNFGCFHIPSSRLLVVCDGENQMNELMNKDPKITISADLKSLVDKASGDFWDAKLNKSSGFMPGFLGMNHTGQYGGIRFSESQARLVQNWVFTDENAAKKAENELQTAAQLLKAGTVPGKKLEGFEITRSGTTVTISAYGPLDGGATGIFGGL